MSRKSVNILNILNEVSLDKDLKYRKNNILYEMALALVVTILMPSIAFRLSKLFNGNLQIYSIGVLDFSIPLINFSISSPIRSLYSAGAAT